jgi:hypothetical protein
MATVFPRFGIPSTASSRNDVSIASFNILAPKFCDARYEWLSADERAWPRRRARLLRDIIALNTGVRIA